MFLHIKKLWVAAICMIGAQYTIAQPKEPFSHPVCRTEVHDTGYYMRNAEAFLAGRLNRSDAMDFSAPYNVRVFIRIVRQDDGTLPGCDAATALQNFNEMNEQYNAHNICFQLAGLDYVNNTYLNNFNTEANLDNVYPDYIRNNNLDVDGAITIFIHYNFLNNSGSSGNAYGIPNNFLSIARWAVTSNTVHSIFGHEMGHCLGLYHTFTRFDGEQESVTRNTGNSCYNCNTDGDLCCDTQADYRYTGNESDNYVNAGCVYSRTYANPCDGLQYNPSTINIMSYMPWSCISFTSTALTANQRTRMHATINDAGGPVYSRVAENTLVLSSITATTNVVRVYSAKNTITTGSSATVTQSGSSKAYYAAGSSITFGPGITFSPGSTGLVQAAIAGCN